MWTDRTNLRTWQPQSCHFSPGWLVLGLIWKGEINYLNQFESFASWLIQVWDSIRMFVLRKQQGKSSKHPCMERGEHEKRGREPPLLSLASWDALAPTPFPLHLTWSSCKVQWPSCCQGGLYRAVVNITSRHESPMMSYNGYQQDTTWVRQLVFESWLSHALASKRD